MQRANRRFHRAVGIERCNVASKAKRGVDSCGVGLIEIRHRDGAEPQRFGNHGAAFDCRTCGFDPHRGGVFVKRCNRTRALAATSAGNCRNGRTVEPPIRQVTHRYAPREARRDRSCFVGIGIFGGSTKLRHHVCRRLRRNPRR
jgi:hypothetical protein